MRGGLLRRTTLVMLALVAAAGCASNGSGSPAAAGAVSETPSPVYSAKLSLVSPSHDCRFTAIRSGHVWSASVTTRVAGSLTVRDVFDDHYAVTIGALAAGGHKSMVLRAGPHAHLMAWLSEAPGADTICWGNKAARNPPPEPPPTAVP